MASNVFKIQGQLLSWLALRLSLRGLRLELLQDMIAVLGQLLSWIVRWLSWQGLRLMLWQVRRLSPAAAEGQSYGTCVKEHRLTALAWR